MKIITLACGAECKVDDDDFEMLLKHRGPLAQTNFPQENAA